MSRDDAARGDSLETQRYLIENFAAASPDIRLVEVYTDNKTTGTNFERPAFQRMLADIERGRINCIIVKDVTRFGRNAIDTGYYLERYLPQRGVRFIAITDSHDSLDGDGGILLPLKNIISESYALDIGRKCRAVQRQNIADGLFVGRLAPYGYKKATDDCHQLTIDADTAPIVHQIFSWASDGVSVNDIARRLSAEGIPSPSHYNYDKGFNKSETMLGAIYWKANTVRKIINDRVYVGDMVQGKTQQMNNNKTYNDPSKWICVPNTHEPIISRDMFDQVQVIRQAVSERAMTIKQNSTPFTTNVFSGKVFCAKCGYPMKRKRQYSNGIYWFRCESQAKYSEGACTVVSVKETDLIAEIMAMLHKQAEAILGKCISLEKAAALPDNCAAELREINAGLDKDGRVLQSLYESMVSGLISKSEFLQMKADYESKIAALSARADEIRNRQYELKTHAVEYRDLADAISAAVCNEKLTAEIIDKLIQEIRVSPDKSFSVLFRFKDEFMSSSNRVDMLPYLSESDCCGVYANPEVRRAG